MKKTILAASAVLVVLMFFTWWTQRGIRDDIAVLKQLVARYEMREQWMTDVQKKLALAGVKTSGPVLERILDAVWELGEKYDVPKDVFAALIYVESSYNPKAVGTSGEIGLCQLLPETAYNVARAYELPVYSKQDLFVIETNVEIGMLHLRDLSKAHGMARALARYNHGRKWASERGRTYARRVLTRSKDYAVP